MTKKKITILVLEDENLLLQAVCKKLKLSGIETVGCTTGQQAIDYLNNLTTLPNAVWLDYYLPDMNGLEFVKHLKEKPSWADIPVFVISNSASNDKVHNMLALGVQKYLLKAEYRLEDIINLINDYLTHQ